ncbi:MAG: glycoside hydrolase family 3 C-terminal domain-containing protein, partial [Alphaproteobacteria bacterium]|nr:glycoside hydrolase family 3 C-terminal domain-containing protein [Alphaproteobacteria bacterium]
EAVRKSLVMLKNNDGLLPFDPRGHIAVVGAAARSMSQQTGGWTLSWQGNDNANDEFETGQTIYEGLKQTITKAGGKISYAASAAQLKGQPDLVIYVFGETPYAEFKGDMSDVVFEFDDGAALANLTALQNKGLPVVSVFLTGRPLWVNPHINRSDAFIVGWLPGTQGGGIADVLAANTDGQPAYNMTGKLSFSWPATGDGAPIDARSTDGVQFPFGYGLSYGDADTAMAALSEDAGIAAPNGMFDGVLMARGQVQAPFGFYLGDSSNWKTPSEPFLSASLGKVLSSRGVDYLAQEDARQLSWRGKGDNNGRGLVSVQTQRQIDLTVLGKEADLSLAVTYRIDTKPTAPVLLAMGCGDNCSAQLDITKPLQNASIGTWQTLAIPLGCFTEKGLNAAAVNAPILLETKGALGLSLTRIALTSKNVVRTCP